jgi:hypothetical protein
MKLRFGARRPDVARRVSLLDTSLARLSTRLLIAAVEVGRHCQACAGGRSRVMYRRMAAYRRGAGHLILNTALVLENLDQHPAADRVLANLVSYAQTCAAYTNN